MTRIKICGIRSVEDALAAVEAGADAIGLNFWRPGKRYIEPHRAKEIVQVLPPFITVVGVFVDETVECLREIVQQVHLHAVQLHDATEPGRYTEAMLASDFGAAFIPVIRPADRSDLDRQYQMIERAGHSGKVVLLDTPSTCLPGGTGQVFDWNLALAAQQRSPIIVAGGLTPENVASAVTMVHPYAVDVAGGVESGPGVKDACKMRDFVQNVRAADSI